MFAGVSAALLPIMVVASFDFGVTWDEDSRHQYGIKVWEFIRGLRDRSSFPETGGHVYPGLFDTLCAMIETHVDWNRYDVRHAINAVFGWIGIVYCGRLAGRLFGPWAAVLAAVLLAISPRYFAGTMNNPKDMPFAAMTVAALYYISLVSPRWPYVTPATGIKIVVSLALALNIRVGALLYLGYLGLLVAFLVVAERTTSVRRLADTASRLALVAAGVLLLGTLFWPWAGGAPFTRPFQALLGASGYPWNGLVLFEGFLYPAQELPWHYAPEWFLISTPVVILAGAFFSLIIWTTRTEWLSSAGLWAVTIIPVAAAVIMHSTLYDGHRHLMFVYPALVVLAAGGWVGMLRAVRSPVWRVAAALALTVGITNVIVFDVRFHPHQGVYFNPLVGGPAEAFKRYDMDYWGNCMFQGVQWAAVVAERFGKPVTVAGYPAHLVFYNSQRVRGVEFTDADENRHHMYLQLARGSTSTLREIAGRPALHRVTTPDGAVLCAIYAGPAYHDLVRPARDSQSRSRPQ